MGYTREQRAANAAKAAAKAAEQVQPESVQLNENIEPAPERDQSVRLPPRNEPRRQAMEEILASREQVDPASVAEAPAEPVAPTAEQILAANTATEAPKVETPVVETPVVEMVKVKIDGVESEVPKADVEAEGGITAYQKSKAAENRLTKANEKLAETNKLQAQIVQWIQQQSAAQPKPAVVTDDEFVQSRLDTIRFEDAAKGAAALKEVIAHFAPKNIDPSSITRQVMLEVNRNAAAENFKKEFQDIITNPILLRTAANLENERGPIAARDPNTDWNNFFRSIGNEIRGAFGRQSQPATAPATPATPTTDTTSQVSEKEARKASIVNLPTAAARAALPTETKPETREDVLNQMRKTRGIPTA